MIRFNVQVLDDATNDQSANITSDQLNTQVRFSERATNILINTAALNFVEGLVANELDARLLTRTNQVNRGFSPGALPTQELNGNDVMAPE